MFKVNWNKRHQPAPLLKAKYLFLCFLFFSIFLDYSIYEDEIVYKKNISTDSDYYGEFFISEPNVGSLIEFYLEVGSNTQKKLSKLELFPYLNISSAANNEEYLMFLDLDDYRAKKYHSEGQRIGYIKIYLGELKFKQPSLISWEIVHGPEVADKEITVLKATNSEYKLSFTGFLKKVGIAFYFSIMFKFASSSSIGRPA